MEDRRSGRGNIGLAHPEGARRPPRGERFNSRTPRIARTPVGPLLLSVIGAINWDVSVFEERFARPGEEIPVRRVEEFSGGKGANAAVAAARVLGRGKVACIGALGDDAVGKVQLSELASEGVVVDGVVSIKGCRSGQAYILIDGQGRKTIHTHFGANARISPRHIRSGACAGVLSRTGMMVVMDPPTPVALSAARAARSNGAKVVYSPGVRTQDGVKTLEAILRMTDYLVVDRIELMNLHEASDEKGALDGIMKAYRGLTVVATLGSAGCMVAQNDSVEALGGVEAALLGKKVLNTTGCGDAFLGVFASYVMMGHGPLESAGWGNLAGAIKATRLETRGSPTRDELERAMRKIKARGS
ncbi:MAG: PfkB family carbohydrate kinase [Thaumarchaeota archaeon]|nr:PfkB family carbohydrate kinase [Nitrososphaerota archaeon]